MSKPNELEFLLREIGVAGQRLAEMRACEGGAGNLSIFVADPLDPGRVFPAVETIELPLAAPALAGGWLLVSGSGTRLRDMLDAPRANLGCLQVDPGGATARLFSALERRFARLTSEFNSHLAVHQDQAAREGARFQAVAHAQPPYITYLSHIPAYQDGGYMSRRLLRWQPETIVQFPHGIGVLPFEIPGSEALMGATTAALRETSLAVWCKHGLMARSAASMGQAVDKIDYAEAAAGYEYLNLTAGEPTGGLSDEEILRMCAKFGIAQTVF